MQNSNRAFTILLVDDRPENNILLEEVLAKNNRKFIAVNDGNEALKQALKHDDIGLIMLDVQMPEMDGFEVAKLLKLNNKTKDIAIIFVTAINKEEQYVMHGFEQGAVDYMQKPLDINMTRAKVNVFEKLYYYQQDLKVALKELKNVNQQLERFVYVVSHDLKSPLASAITILSSLQKHPVIEGNNDVSEKVDFVQLATRELSDMISSILEYSKQSFSEQSIDEVNTYDLVSQVLFLLFPPATIKICIAEDMPIIKTHKSKLQQVFQNLLSNAIKYADKSEGLIEIGVNKKKTFYEFFVRDNGPGIPTDESKRMFNLFYKISENEESTGVGLNIVKVIVEEQGGQVWADTQPGSGSTFYFEWKK